MGRVGPLDTAEVLLTEIPCVSSLEMTVVPQDKLWVSVLEKADDPVEKVSVFPLESFTGQGVGGMNGDDSCTTRHCVGVS